jgi:rod shape-determining protein MreB
MTGLPKTVEVTEAEIYDAIIEPVRIIIETVQVALERTPPELAADMIDQGIVMAGGGALLRGLDALLREETGLPVTIADNPLLSVVRGVGLLLDDIDLLERVSIER